MSFTFEPHDFSLVKKARLALQARSERARKFKACPERMRRI